MRYPELRLQMFKKEESLADIAKVIGKDRSTVSRKLNGKVKFSYLEQVQLARHYRTSIKKLF